MAPQEHCATTFSKSFFGKFFYQTKVLKKVRKFNVLKLFLPYLPFVLKINVTMHIEVLCLLFVYESEAFYRRVAPITLPLISDNILSAVPSLGS